MTHTRTIRLMMASAALLTLAGPAFALDGADMMKKLSAAFEVNGTSVTFDKAEANGDVVTASGVKLQVAAQPGESIKIGDVTFEGVEETDRGGYYAETVSFADVNVSEKEDSVSIKDIAIGGLSIPANASGGTIDDILLYESFGTGPMEVKVKGKDVFKIASIESNLTRRENDAGFDFDGTMNGLYADLSEVEDAKAKDAIEARPEADRRPDDDEGKLGTRERQSRRRGICARLQEYRPAEHRHGFLRLHASVHEGAAGGEQGRTSQSEQGRG